MRKIPKRKVSKRKVELTAKFAGDGRVVDLSKKGRGPFFGGVPGPKIEPGDLSYSIYKEYKDRNGIWNPRDSRVPVKGGFQISIKGTSKGFRKLAEYFLSLAEINSRADDGFHEHVEGIWDANKNVRLHLIFRKTYKAKIRNPSS